jgi:hypothetical protein
VRIGCLRRSAFPESPHSVRADSKRLMLKPMTSLLWLVRLANARMQTDEPEREMADAGRLWLRPF